MRLLYTIFTHGGDSPNYKGLSVSATHVSEYLNSLGMPIARENVVELANGKRWSNKVIIVRHEVREEVLLTTDLLKILELAGTKEAERLLKNRNKTKHEK